MSDLPSDWTVLRDDPLLHAAFLPGSSDRLVVHFSDAATGDAAMLRAGSASGQNHVLRLSDPQQSWLNARGLIEAMTTVVATHTARIGATDIVLQGVSAGGFCALVMGRAVQAGLVIAFSPQIAVEPSCVPFETRWPEARARIRHFAVRSALEYLRDDITYLVAYDEGIADAPHRALIPMRPNISFLLVPGDTNDAADVLSQAEHLTPFLNQLYARNFMAARANLRPVLNEVVFSVAGY